MTKKTINQNDYYKLELLSFYGFNYRFNEKPIYRIKNKNNLNNLSNEDKIGKIKEIEIAINAIKNCKLKKNARQLVLGDGNINSPLMIVGGAPAKKEDMLGKTFVGEDSELLEKMLNSINIKKKNIYSTYAVNYRPEEDRKPTSKEIKCYSEFLKKHISIINPKLIILMGSIALESLFGLNLKISLERGTWKEIIIKNTNYNIMITFDPSYLLRTPYNKKFSWEDLKKIKKKISEFNLTI